MGAGQSLAEVCVHQRKSLTSQLHAHSRLPWSCSKLCIYKVSTSHSPCQPSGLHPAGQAQPCGPVLCPEREASSSSPLPSASAAGWGCIAVDGLCFFLLWSRWPKCPPLSPDWVHRCPHCEVRETGQVAAGPPRRLLCAPLCLPWQQWSEQVTGWWPALPCPHTSDISSCSATVYTK